MSWRIALWAAVGIVIFAGLGCGNSHLTSVSLTRNSRRTEFPQWTSSVQGFRYEWWFNKTRAVD
jgi:hypothetical protein